MVKRHFCSAAASILVVSLLIPTSARAWGSVKMYTDESYTKKIKRKKLDCKIHANKTRSLTLGFKLGGALIAKVGPEVSFAKTTQIRWNGLSQEIIRRYEELCDQHNKGHLTVAEFNRRHEKLEEFFEKAKDLKGEIQDNVFSRADKAFDDLDREAAKHSGAGFSEELQEKIRGYDKAVDDLAGEVDEAFGIVREEGDSSEGDPEAASGEEEPPAGE